jgi:uncharacterized DUF497 family protein
MCLIKVEWSNEKNELIKKTRNVCFEDVYNAILNDKVLDIIPHPNQNKYPNQKIIILKINNYVYYVPYVINKDKMFLKTIIPSRKYNKIYNLKD